MISVAPWRRKAYRTLGLFWAGSLCANMSVFIAGIVTGGAHS